MQLKHAAIYGFGKWVDYSIDFSGGTFICVYGENESGKSTLQQFILFMLFGLPPKKRHLFRPKTSGKMGGRLTVADPVIGDFTIERFDEIRNGAALCYTSDGESHDEAWLQERLSGMTHAVYQSIFSFSATDLTDIQTMQEEELSEVLLGIGMTGSKNIHTMEKQLETKIGELFKPFGKKPEINQQLDLLDELHASLQRYRNSEAAYRDKKSASHALTEAINQQQDELKDARKNLYQIEKLQQALPVLKEYHHKVKQWSDFPERIRFPENGLERLETLNDTLLPLKSELSVLQDNQKKYLEKQDLIRAEMYEETVYKTAERIIRERQDYLHNQQKKASIQESIKKTDLQISAEVDQLDIGIAKEDIKTINLPFHMEKMWNQLKKDMDQLTLENEQLQQKYRQITKNRDFLTNQQKERKASLLKENQTEELTKRINDYNQQMFREETQQAAAGQQHKWKSMRDKNKKNANIWLAAGSVTTIFMGVFAFLQSQPLLLGAAALILAVAVIQWRSGRKSFQAIERILQNEGEPDTSVTLEEKREAEHLLDLNDKTKSELSSINEKLRSIDIDMLQWNEKKSIFDQKEKRLSEQVNSQYNDYPFLRQLDITYWPELFHTLKNIIKLDREKRQFDSQYNLLANECELFQEKVDHFFKERNWESLYKSTVDKLMIIEELLEDYQKRTTLLNQYEKETEENADEQRRMKQKMHIYQQEITDLFLVAGSETEDEFIRQGKQLKEKNRYETELDQLNEQLVKILPESLLKEALEEKIYDSELEVHHSQTEEEIKLLEANIDEKRQERADIDADLTTMESSESYSETLHRFSMEQEQLQKLAKDWSVYKTAKEVLSETKRNYRDKYLAAVIEKTAYYFQTLTDNNYTRIYPPKGNRPFQTETGDGIRYKVHELSQGTVNQLYVSLRLGISEVMSEKHRMPFIIDDAFVHFDAVRTERILELLSEISRHQQIILFTCKKEVAEHAADAKILDLPESSVRIN